MPKLYLDFGNANVKWYNGETTSVFRHAIAFISQRQWEDLLDPYGYPPPGYIMVNGVYAAIGDRARRHTIKERPAGAARYTREYFGMFLCAALTGAFYRSSDKVALYASHAPQDIRYTNDIREAALGEWNVVTHNGVYSYSVIKVETFDEPLGGFNHYVLTNAGMERKNNPVRDKVCLVLDVGGYTVDAMAVDAGGEIDPASLKSTRTGVIQLLENFEADMRARYPQDFRDAGDLDPLRVELALNTGAYGYGNVRLDVDTERRANMLVLVNDILDIVRANGGVQNFDVILLTGGGAALIEEPLAEVLPMIELIRVEPDRDKMQFANVVGGAKLFKLLERLHAI